LSYLHTAFVSTVLTVGGIGHAASKEAIDRAAFRVCPAALLQPAVLDDAAALSSDGLQPAPDSVRQHLSNPDLGVARVAVPLTKPWDFALLMYEGKKVCNIQLVGSEAELTLKELSRDLSKSKTWKIAKGVPAVLGSLHSQGFEKRAFDGVSLRMVLTTSTEMPFYLISVEYFRD
jgi:hypothetical protein